MKKIFMAMIALTVIGATAIASDKNKKAETKKECKATCKDKKDCKTACTKPCSSQCK